MDWKALLPCTRGLSVIDVTVCEGKVNVGVVTDSPSACCPTCNRPSTRVHSRYQRRLADLPSGGLEVHIRLTSRKFFCSHAKCKQRIFTERMPSLAMRYARKTKPLQEILYLLGHSLGGEAGTRVAVRLGVSVSPDTLIEQVRRRAPSVDSTPVRVLGVDDFAFLRGRTYGTILVDLEKHCVLDMLPDRTAESFASWLTAHPGVEVISRDRATAYAEGAKAGAPKAQQVADRWHLLKNAGDVLERLLTRQYSHMKEASRKLATEDQTVPPENETISNEETVEHTKSIAQEKRARLPSRLERVKAQRGGKRRMIYDHVRELYNQGYNKNAIAEETGLRIETVYKYLRSDECRSYPEKSLHHPNHAERFDAYLKQRWGEGCHNAVTLFDELKSQGYKGQYSALAIYVRPWRVRLRKGDKSAPRKIISIGIPSPRSARWWLMGWFNTPDPALRLCRERYIDSLKSLCPEIATAHQLANEFVTMVKKRLVANLDGWLERAGVCCVAEMVGFAKGIRSDLSAVKAALATDWSNGQTEGQVNRLKQVNRQMYGRANFALLRARTLPMALPA